MRNSLLALVGATLFLAGCGADAPKETAVVKVPDVFAVKFETTKGDFTIEAHRDWAPFGVDRFHELVRAKYFDDARFFRVLKGFIVQFGINKEPAVSAKWRDMRLPDDPVKQKNTRGMVTYAKGGPNTRTTQLFINTVDNADKLDSMGFAPFGLVVDGMKVVDALYGGYGESSSQGGAGPDQQLIQARGNQYLDEHYPKLDSIKTARILQ